MSSDPATIEKSGRELAIAAQALGALEAFANRVEPAPVVNVTVPEREVHVDVAPAQVEVTVEPPELPAFPEIPVPQVDFHAPAPVVAAPEVRLELPPPRAIRVEQDEEGNRRYVPE